MRNVAVSPTLYVASSRSQEAFSGLAGCFFWKARAAGSAVRQTITATKLTVQMRRMESSNKGTVLRSLFYHRLGIVRINAVHHQVGEDRTVLLHCHPDNVI